MAVFQRPSKVRLHRSSSGSYWHKPCPDRLCRKLVCSALTKFSCWNILRIVRNCARPAESFCVPLTWLPPSHSTLQNHRTQEFDAGKITLLGSRPEWAFTSFYIHSFSWYFWCVVLWHFITRIDSCNYDHNLIQKKIIYHLVAFWPGFWTLSKCYCKRLCLAVFSEYCVYKQCTVATM